MRGTGVLQDDLLHRSVLGVSASSTLAERLVVCRALQI